MRDRPFGADLIAAARQTLLDDVLPHLPGEKRLAGLMIANALGIAAREAKAGERPLREAVSALAALYGAQGSPRGEDAEAHFRDLAMQVVRDLRAGGMAPERAARLHAILVAFARARVAEANPKYLADADARAQGPFTSR